jgi:trehalose-6-phosphate synthase
VNPYDPDAVAAAITRAVAMPLDERKSRHAELYTALLRNDISKWGDKFLKALNPPGKQSEEGLSGFMPGPPDAESGRRPVTRQ